MSASSAAPNANRSAKIFAGSFRGSALAIVYAELAFNNDADAAGGIAIGAGIFVIPTMPFVGECSGGTIAMMDAKPTHNIALICIQSLKRLTVVGAKSTV
jgi:hypothetical protein